ncbi:MAG: xanthine dehydrogenase family protein subunit M [Pseudomonadota bacterium]
MVVFYRRMPRFAYLCPGSLPEALRILQDNHDGRYRVYAGGTDLMPKLKKRMIETPQAVVDLKGLPELDYIRFDPEQGLVIGALASIASVAASPVIRDKFPALAQGAGNIAATHIQNRGTIAGNICSALPSADSAPALLALEAQVNCLGQTGRRTVPLAEFFSGPGQTCLGSDELVEDIRVPPAGAGLKGVYYKLSPRRRMDLAVVGVAVVGRVEDGRVQDVRIGLGAVAPTPLRARQAEAEIMGAPLEASQVDRAARAAAAEARPIDDHRASAEYRRLMVEVLVRRGLQALAA